MSYLGVLAMTKLDELKKQVTVAESQSSRRHLHVITETLGKFTNKLTELVFLLVFEICINVRIYVAHIEGRT